MAEEQTTDQSDKVDQAEQNTEKRPAKKISQTSRWHNLKTWYADRKKWTIPLSVLVLILILAGVPFSRYHLAGLVLKRDLSVKLLDSTTNSPISGATVSLGSLNAQTDAAGKATLHHVKVGHHKLTISKKYYQSKTIDLLTPILNQKSIPSAEMVATGRQVKITVKNLINHNALKNVAIKIAGTSAQTDQSGSTIVVIPAGVNEQKATLSLDGFNDAEVTVKVSNDKVQDNEFSLTPSGKVYFLSKLSGKIDVVKANLDGSTRQTVLAGTGNEDDRNTVLLASRDWKYLALLARRAGDFDTLYLIDTSNDTLSTIDQGNAGFSLVGWAGDSFVYYVTRNTLQIWQPKHQAIKSFDANTKKVNVLDETNAQGTGFDNYAAETYSTVNLSGNTVLFAKTWSFSYSFLYAQAPTINDKNAGIYSVNAAGANPQKLKLFPYNINSNGENANYDVSIYIDSVPSGYEGIYYQETLYNGESSSVKYFEYDNNKLAENTKLAQNFTSALQNGYPTYLQSPSGSLFFWAESRDGKNTLLVGEDDGNSPKQIATLSDYTPYGWFTDNYLLVSKNASELYIMPRSGSQNPVKISDYHKPAQTFNGYGGGYGGL